MDWTGSLRPFVPRPEPSLNFLYNYNYDPYQGTPSLLTMYIEFILKYRFVFLLFFYAGNLKEYFRWCLSFLLPH